MRSEEMRRKNDKFKSDQKRSTSSYYWPATIFYTNSLLLGCSTRSLLLTFGYEAYPRCCVVYSFFSKVCSLDLSTIFYSASFYL
jgi:hypothetical protein